MIDPSGIRRSIVDMTVRSGEGHLGSSFSIVEMLIGVFTAAQCRGKFNPSNLILSKGHASYAYYAFLHEVGLFSTEELHAVGTTGSKWYGHLPYIGGDARFPFGSGSLGHGLPFALGLAFALRARKFTDPVFCIIGDGEANEGTFWETLLLINKLRPTGFKLLIDCNNSSERAVPIGNAIAGLAAAFPYLRFHICDGHSPSEIHEKLDGEDDAVLICKTHKGFPIPFMMDNPVWHHKIPTSEEARAIKECLR